MVNVTLTLEGTNLQTQAEVNITMLRQTPKLDSPTASVQSGKVDSGTTVELYSVEGATIYYTTDGSSPLSPESRIEYTKPIVISEDVTVLAVASMDGYDDSEVAEFMYTVEIKKEVVLVIGITSESEKTGYAIKENALIVPAGATIQDVLSNIYKVSGSGNIGKLEVYKGDEKIARDKPIGTGMRFVLEGSNPNEVTNIDFIVKKGDLTGEGKVDIDDAKCLLEALVGNIDLDKAQQLAVRLAVENYDNIDSAIKKLRAFLTVVTAIMVS